MADKRARDQLARAAAAFHTRHLSPLILMTDDERLPDPIAAAKALPRGSMVILRARTAATLARYALALRAIAKARDLRLLIATDASLAAKTGAHGIHLPETEAHRASHWRTRRPDWIITVAAHSLPTARKSRCADAILLSPVFPTQSHPGSKTLGPIQARIIARLLHKPVYALGGIDAGTIKRLNGAKLAGIAALGALNPSAA
jgi:thiamine-phosphate pyrophosphorylase